MNSAEHLAAFLAARLDEDETAAQAVAGMPHALTAFGAVAQYIASVSPERVLREVQAKRNILRRCRLFMNEMDEHPNGLVSARALQSRLVLMELASVYSEHPEYPAQWWPA